MVHIIDKWPVDEIFMEKEFKELYNTATRSIMALVFAAKRGDYPDFEKWKVHFQKLKVPYAITTRGTQKKLWKERIV